MNRAATFDSLDWEGLLGVALAQAEAVERQGTEIAPLRTEIAELRAKLDRPPKTPDNSSVPPSQGQKKTTEFVKSRRKKKTHPGAHRPVHPNPTHERNVKASVWRQCGADVSESPQEPCEAYDRIEIPPIAPEVTRVTLHGGVCPCCAKRFKAAAPAAGARLAVRPQSARLRHLFALHPGRRLRAAVAPDARPVRPRHQRRRAGQHLVGGERAFRGDQRRHSRPAVVGNRDLFRRDRLAGRPARLVAVGLPPRPKRLFPDPSPTLQGGGRGVPRRHAPGRLDLRPLRRPSRLGQERAAGLPRPSPARHPIRHRRGRRRFRSCATPLHRHGVREGARRDKFNDVTLNLHKRRRPRDRLAPGPARDAARKRARRSSKMARRARRRPARDRPPPSKERLPPARPLPPPSR